MIRLLLMMFILVGCGKPIHGKNGLNGIDGNNFYSYLIAVNLQEIIGDNRDEEIQLNEIALYQFPSEFDVTVDNTYPECELQELELVIESQEGQHLFIFQPTNNRYKMELKSGPVNKVVDSSYLKVYHKKVPEVDCGGNFHQLHSGISFSVRIIKELQVD